MFELIVGLNCYEMYSTLHGYDKFETLVIDYCFLVTGTLKIETMIINFVCFAILSYCHLSLLLCPITITGGMINLLLVSLSCDD